MIKIDMWYGDDHKEADKIDVSFYANDGEYRGNIYKTGKMIGDYTCNGGNDNNAKVTCTKGGAGA